MPPDDILPYPLTGRLQQVCRVLLSPVLQGLPVRTGTPVYFYLPAIAILCMYANM